MGNNTSSSYLWQPLLYTKLSVTVLHLMSITIWFSAPLAMPGLRTANGTFFIQYERPWRKYTNISRRST